MALRIAANVQQSEYALLESITQGKSAHSFCVHAVDPVALCTETNGPPTGRR